jgi:hypothetical protein
MENQRRMYRKDGFDLTGIPKNIQLALKSL